MSQRSDLHSPSCQVPRQTSNIAGQLRTTRRASVGEDAKSVWSPDAVSIMQTGDTTRSDFDLAGLAVRCQDGGVEVLSVLTGVLSLRTHPNVAVSAGGKSMDFTATFVPPGASLLLPKTVTGLASGLWAATSEMTV